MPDYRPGLALPRTVSLDGAVIFSKYSLTLAPRDRLCTRCFSHACTWYCSAHVSTPWLNRERGERNRALMVEGCSNINLAAVNGLFSLFCRNTYLPSEN